MESGNVDPLGNIGAPETENDALHIAVLENRLVPGDFGKLRIWF